MDMNEDFNKKDESLFEAESPDPSLIQTVVLTPE
jgi:hypothetical protein